MDALRAARASGRLPSGTAVTSPLETDPCRFLPPDTHLCVLHRDLGAAFKPASCRHFPRIALLDARGVSLTLSHFCPTAASLLFRKDVPLAVVENPSSFSPTDDYEGLDARGVLPPLLRPDVLWDLEGYSTWEEQAVALLAHPGVSPESGIARLRTIAAQIEEWTPGSSPLAAHVRERFVEESRTASTEKSSRWGEQSEVVSRYLAARLFASWVPYRADRLTALIDDLEATHGVLEEEAAQGDLREAVRMADLRVVHRGAL
jgi:hypothetical protein